LFASALSFWAASCAVALGPGYTIEKQEIRVRFAGAPELGIHIVATYQLKNTGTRPLQELELRLPGRRFVSNEIQASWDGRALPIVPSLENPRNARLRLSEPWRVSSRHTLLLARDLVSGEGNEASLSFSRDAFFLPAAGWNAELLPPDGLFATGGVPPKKWELLVSVPQGFHTHVSGTLKRNVQKGGETVFAAEQGAKDPYPFTIAGRFHDAEVGAGEERVHLWTSQEQESAKLRGASETLERVIAGYDAAFGERTKRASQTWIVECPVVKGCFTSFNPRRARLLGQEENERTTAEMISQDTMVVDLTGGPPALAVAAAPSLAASWLGYARNPGYYEQRPPLSMFTAFAAAIGREAAEGGDTRSETIRRALRLIPSDTTSAATTTNTKSPREEDPNVLRAKSFLFFYALQDRYGPEAFRKATQHVLYARQEHEFELSDLIAAFEQETRQNVAEFVRMWMKRPGVPEEFRARYEGTAAASDETNTRRAP